jgi:hypothetical protein
MRTVIIIVGGLVLLGMFLAAGRWLGGDSLGMVRAARYFIPLWLAIAAINLYIGVTQAGYTVAEEAPIFAVIFAVPALVAAVVWWRFARAFT